MTKSVKIILWVMLISAGAFNFAHSEAIKKAPVKTSTEVVKKDSLKTPLKAAVKETEKEAAKDTAKESAKAVKTVKAGFTANVMAPLYVKDMGEFEKWLSTAKLMGVDAVTVDVWWGDVEKKDNEFTWSYYDTLFAKIKSQGLKMVPIMSFHQCGGNVGDDYTSKLPAWVWEKGKDMKYKSEQGNYSEEYVSLWADTVIKKDYIDFMNSFERHFSGFSKDFLELNVSCGPSGELRYPSYNSHDKGSGYPTRGAFQGYSDRAKDDFRAWVKAKYKTLQAVQESWKTDPPVTSWSMVNVPSKDSGNQMDEFWYYNADKSNYGRDLFTWYNDALIKHGKRMIGYAIKAFDSSMAGVDLGYKVPGIHWRVSDKYRPRAAELNGGLIPGYENYNDSNGNGYDKIVSIPRQFKRKVILHFTCLEMDDKENEDGKYVASRAKTLVFWVGNEAARQGVAIKGENALAFLSDHGWDNIDNATTWSSYNGLTVLRIGNVTTQTTKDRYRHYIMKFKGIPFLSIRGTFNNWVSVPMSKSGDIWTLKNLEFGNSASESFKFDVFNDWFVNFGGDGSEGPAIRNGKNIPVTAGKKYDIMFNESLLTFKVEPSQN